MSKVKHKAELYIIAGKFDDKGNPIEGVERIDIPVQAFEVDGGANRKINLDSPSEVFQNSSRGDVEGYTTARSSD